MSGVRVWLNVSYNKQGYDVGIKDPDEYSYMDLLDDLEAEGFKQNIIPAKVPIVKYYEPNLNKLIEIDGDIALVKMFKNLGYKVDIDLHVEESETPSDGVQCWLNLKKSRENARQKKEDREKKQRENEEKKQREDEERRKREEEEIIPPLSKAVPIFNVEGDKVLDKNPDYYIVDLDTGKFIGQQFFGPAYDGVVSGSSQKASGSQKAQKRPQKLKPVRRSPRRAVNIEPLTPQHKDQTPPPTSQPTQEPNSQPPPETQHQPETPPETQQEPETPPETQQEPETPPETQQQPQTPPETQQQPETQPETQPENQHSQPETQPETQHSQPETQPQTKSKFPKPTYGTRRIPKSTAKRAGIFKPKTSRVGSNQGSVDGGETEQPAATATGSGEEVGTGEAVQGSGGAGEADQGSGGAGETDQGSVGGGGQATGVAQQSDEVELPWIEDNAYDPHNLHKLVIDGKDVDEQDNDAYLHKVYKNGQLYVHHNFGEIELLKWDIFFDKEHLINSVIDYAIQEGAYIVREKVDNKRYTVVCGNADCNWRIHASVLLDGVSWAIKSINSPHTCQRLEHNPMAGKKWCMSKILDDVRANFQIPISAVKELLLERYGVSVPESTLYKARTLAVKEIQGSHDESYAQLLRYIYVIKEVDSEAFAFISWINEGPEHPLTFRRMYVSFEAQYKGFIKGCRPMIGIDGCHLKGNFNGVILSAIALDGNQQIFPIAYAIVSEESKDNWTYFFRCLKHTLASSNKDDWVFMSDRMRGVEGCIKSEFPHSTRRICCRHLYKNFKDSFPGPYFEAYFWQAADAYNEWIFKQAMTKMKKLDAAAYHYLMDIDLSLWTRWKFNPTISCSDNTNNFTESWNATLGLDRVRPIMGLLEGIRRSCMVRIGTRQAESESWNTADLTPYAKEQIRKNSEDARMCKLYVSGRGKYEVVEGKTSFPINLEEMWCKCGRWQIDGIPCKHALRVINNCRLNPYLYVSEYYSVSNYKLTYDLTIPPMPDQSQWPEREVPHINPPEVKRTVGRPKRNRRREPGEKPKGKRSVTIRCSKCGILGHNKNGCKGGLTASQKKSQGDEAGGTTTTKKRGREEGVSTQDHADVIGVSTKKGRKTKKAKAK